MTMNKSPWSTSEELELEGSANETIQDAGFDIPDERDWHYSSIIEESGGSVRDDMKYIKDFLYIFNQGLDPLTLNSCGWCSKIHVINAQNLLNTSIVDDQISVKSEWLDYNQVRPEYKKYRGTVLQDNLKYFRDELKYISWYWLAQGIDEAKAAIDNRHFICTWSNNGDWTSVRVNKLYKKRTDGRIVGHLFCIVGYDDKWFIAVNSYWRSNWYFTIPYDEYAWLYSKYAILPNKDLPAIQKYRMAKTIQESIAEAIQLGITNGENMDSPATRAEVVTMVVRGIDAALKKWEDLFVTKQ